MSTRQIPTPKYQIGDKVWRGGFTTTQRSLECPDCLGERKWSVTTPSGRDVQMRCPRCVSWGSCQPAKITERVPTATLLTIGQVRIEWPATLSSSDSDPISYMAEETGVGGGTIYYERSLFPTKDEAEAYGRSLAEADRLRQSEESKRREARALEWSSLDIIDVQIAEANEQKRAAEHALENLQNDIGELFEDYNHDLTVRDLRTRLRELIPVDCLPREARS